MTFSLPYQTLNHSQVSTNERIGLEVLPGKVEWHILLIFFGVLLSLQSSTQPSLKMEPAVRCSLRKPEKRLNTDTHTYTDRRYRIVIVAWKSTFHNFYLSPVFRIRRLIQITSAKVFHPTDSTWRAEREKWSPHNVPSPVIHPTVWARQAAAKNQSLQPYSSVGTLELARSKLFYHPYSVVVGASKFACLLTTPRLPIIISSVVDVVSGIYDGKNTLLIHRDIHFLPVGREYMSFMYNHHKEQKTRMKRLKKKNTKIPNRPGAEDSTPGVMQTEPSVCYGAQALTHYAGNPIVLAKLQPPLSKDSANEEGSK